MPTMTLRLLRWWRGMRGSSVCRKAMPRAMSNANFTACIWSTTKSGKGVTGGQPTLSPPRAVAGEAPAAPTPSPSTHWSPRAGRCTGSHRASSG